MSDDKTTPLDLARYMVSTFTDGDLLGMALSTALVLVLGFWIFGISYGIFEEVVKTRHERRQRAMRRHPSARSTMTPEEFHYHSSNQWGR